MKAMKFDTGGDENLSRKIQERLFEMGYEWISGKDVKHTDATYLFANQDGMIAFGIDETRFNKRSNQLTTYDDIRTPQRGERVLVWNNNESKAVERIFLTKIEGAISPIQVVDSLYQESFLNGGIFNVVQYKHMKPLNDKLSELGRKYKELGDEIERIKRGCLQQKPINLCNGL